MAVVDYPGCSANTYAHVAMSPIAVAGPTCSMAKSEVAELVHGHASLSRSQPKVMLFRTAFTIWHKCG